MTQATLPFPTSPVRLHRGPLAPLLGLLTEEVSRKEPSTWAFRQLPHGALVAVQVDDEGRRVLRLARARRPDTERGLKAWGVEVQTFLKQFGAERWEPLPADEAVGIAARFRELFPQEHRAGFTRCEVCDLELPFDKIWGTPPCPSCTKRGVET